jgi:ubiquitin C-terminal hydrolase
MLCGVVVHSGGMGGGHYIAYIRARSNDNDVNDVKERAMKFIDFTTTGTHQRGCFDKDMLMKLFEQVCFICWHY